MRTVLLCTLLLTAWSAPGFGQLPKEITNSIGMKQVLIPAGTFTMGAPIGVGRDHETPHEVTISKAYYLGVYEVTVGQYKKVTGENPYDKPKIGLPKKERKMTPFQLFQLQAQLKKDQLQNRKPVSILDTPIPMSWDDAVSFCKQLSEMPEEKAVGREYRLPTEAEWEYACRAGSKTAYSFGDSEESLWEYAWFRGNAESYHPVGEKKGNKWGLYDMHGNISEWCQDLYWDYPLGAVTDPQGATTRMNWGRVHRGGSCVADAEECRSASRAGATTGPGMNGFASFGIRVVMSPSVK